MKLLQESEERDEFRGQYIWWCVGCECPHFVWIEHPNSLSPIHWSFNGNFEKPTFSPSILVHVGGKNTCHCFITDGRINYCGDSHHKLAGQSVEMVNWDGDETAKNLLTN